MLMASRLRADSCCSIRAWEAPREERRDGQEDQQAEQRGQLVDCRTDGRPQLALGRTEDAEQGSGRIHGKTCCCCRRRRDDGWTTGGGGRHDGRADRQTSRDSADGADSGHADGADGLRATDARAAADGGAQTRAGGTDGGRATGADEGLRQRKDEPAGTGAADRR